MARYDILPSWLRPKAAQEPRLDDTYRAIDETLPVLPASRREPALPAVPAAKATAPAALGPSAPASGAQARGTHITIRAVDADRRDPDAGRGQGRHPDGAAPDR